MIDLMQSMQARIETGQTKNDQVDDGSIEIFSVPVEEFYKPLNDSPTAEDIALTQHNRHPELLTVRLHQLVPLLRTLDFRLTTVTDHETVGAVHLLASTMNQNGTHQAGVFYIMLDYIAGTAIYAVLPGT